jgi:hypothetical protein
MGLQDLAVGALALVALAWLARRAWRRRRSAGCDDCPGCAPSGAPPAARPEGPESVILPVSEVLKSGR